MREENANGAVMGNGGTQPQTMHGAPWLRLLCAAMVTFTGTAGGAAAIVYFASSHDSLHQAIGLGVLLGALLLVWLGLGLLQDSLRSWVIYQHAGIVITSVGGVALLLAALPSLIGLLTSDPALVSGKAIPAVAGAVVLLCWAVAMVADREATYVLWQLISVPAAVAAVILAIPRVSAAGKDDQYAILGAAAVWVLVVGWRALASLSERPHATASEQVLSPLDDLADEISLESFPAALEFPSRHHEIFAKGRFCELFELPCDKPCPLSTKVAEKYQQLRLEYQDSPKVLRLLEEAYAILVTPRSRALCRIARQIMDAKARQLGPKRFAAVEAYLWRKIWKRLHDDELNGDPRKAQEISNRLIKEL